MKEILKRNSIFLGLSLILIVVLGLALLYIPQGDLHLWLCDRHTPARDIFYRYYTRVAEWFPYVVCVYLLVFGRIGEGVFATSALVLSSLTTQVLKHIIQAPRPLTWFAEHMPDVQLPLVEGVRMNYWLSFPSGHTTSFFALALVVCMIYTRETRETRKTSTTSGLIQTLLFYLAALGGYSRIYLSQHFPKDVFAGMIIGIGITLLCYVVFYRFKDQKWFNFRLFQKK